MTPKEIIAVVQHFDAGGKVQSLRFNHQEWRDIDDPEWNFEDYDYRPKPKSLELWVNVYDSGQTFVHRSEEAARLSLESGRTVHMREVVDEDS